MLDLSLFTGTAQFGPAYKIMLENYPCPAWTVDQILGRRMVRICGETAAHLYTGFTSTYTTYRRGTRPGLERVVETLPGNLQTSEDIVRGVATFTRCLNPPRNTPTEEIVFGGTEEEIIARGSEFCGEHARVACALLQVHEAPGARVELVRAAGPHGEGLHAHRPCPIEAVQDTETRKESLPLPETELLADHEFDLHPPTALIERDALGGEGRGPGPEGLGVGAAQGRTHLVHGLRYRAVPHKTGTLHLVTTLAISRFLTFAILIPHPSLNTVDGGS